MAIAIDRTQEQVGRMSVEEQIADLRNQVSELRGMVLTLTASKPKRSTQVNESELAKRWAGSVRGRWYHEAEWSTYGERSEYTNYKRRVEGDIQKWLETQGITPTRVLIRKIEFLVRAELPLHRPTHTG